jgi:hypothetical protein
MIVEETGDSPICPICHADEHCNHLVADIDRTFLECHEGEFHEWEDNFRSEIQNTFIENMERAAKPVWKLDEISELWRNSLSSYDRDENYVDLDGYVYYRLVVEMLENAGAIDHAGQVIDESGPGMTSAVTLLYAHNPKMVVGSALKALQSSLKDLS